MMEQSTKVSGVMEGYILPYYVVCRKLGTGDPAVAFAFVLKGNF